MSSEGDKPSGSATLLFRGVPAALQFSATEKQTLGQFARVLSQEAAEGRGFTCLITNDRELKRLNRYFLEHDYATDVLSFPSAVSGGSGRDDLGEIAISVERAAAQAEDFGHSCADEVKILMLHGALHLTGLDHERDRGEMARAERRWRSRFALPSSLLSRTRGVGARIR